MQHRGHGCEDAHTDEHADQAEDVLFVVRGGDIAVANGGDRGKRPVHRHDVALHEPRRRPACGKRKRKHISLFVSVSVSLRLSRVCLGEKIRSVFYGSMWLLQKNAKNAKKPKKRGFRTHRSSVAFQGSPGYGMRKRASLFQCFLYSMFVPSLPLVK